MLVCKVTKWRTSDGVEHSSRAMADYHILTERLAADLKPYLDSAPEPHDVLNLISSRAKDIREWLDAGEHMTKVASGQCKDTPEGEQS